MPISVLSVERPDSASMNRPNLTRAQKTKESDYVRKGDWDITGLSKKEIIAKLDESYEKSKEDIKSGNYVLAEDFYKEFKKRHKECAIG